MKPLDPKDLYAACRTQDFRFKSTRTLEPLDEIIGQSRAQDAVRFAMAMPYGGYNIYASGRNGLGKRTMILRYLSRHAGDSHNTSDWCYVANFSEPRLPKVLRLPPGLGNAFRQDMEKLLNRLVRVIPQAFESDAYLERAEEIKNDYGSRQEKALEKVAKQAQAKQVNLSLSTPGGYRLVAMNGAEPHSAESFAALPETERQKFDEVIGSLEKKLRSTLRKLADWEQEYADRQQALSEETVSNVSSALLEELREKYSRHPEVTAYLKAMEKDLVENLEIFLEDSEEQAALAYAALDKKMPRRYQVNTLVSHKNATVPVVVEDNPTYHNLFGYVENITFKGTVITDFSLIRGGSLHRANGGFLLMDAIKVLEQPFVWDGLKRALRARNLSINSLERELTLSGTISLDPEPIPLDVKIILFGDVETYHLLHQHDPEFSELFRVKADFENEMPRNADSHLLYAKFIASLVVDKGMLHCDRGAVTRIIEYSARLAEHKQKLSLHAADIAKLLRESDYWARREGANLIHHQHVDQALASAEHRNSRLKDHLYDGVRDGTTLLTTSGTAVGQINALSVLSTGEYEFGMVSRISVTCHYGDGSVMDIEREVKLGGNIHSKGVMILTGYLNNIFARLSPMHLSAAVTFEQSYGEVDGDSASLAELCALISALAEAPLRQDLAMTGSVNQFGEVQPVGGVNEKIEGFFECCRIQGLTGQQGVILPASNVNNLMLDLPLREAAKRGEFRVYAVADVTEALQLLTGIPVGKADKDGRFPPDTLYGRIQARMQRIRDLERAEDDQEDASGQHHKKPAKKSVKKKTAGKRVSVEKPVPAIPPPTVSQKVLASRNGTRRAPH